jgi:hypothetical protein
VLSWWETLGRQDSGRIVVWRDSSEKVRAVLPLGHGRLRLHPKSPLSVRCLTNLGGGQGAADHCGFAVDLGWSDEVGDWLDRLARRHTVLLHNLDDSGIGIRVPVHARVVGQSACPRMVIPADEESVGGSAKLQKQLRAYGRRLAAAGVTFRWVAPGAVDEAVLDALFALHGRRSEHAGRTSTFAAARRPFHGRLVQRARDGYGPAAVLAERDGAIVGVLYGFRWRDEFAYYQSGWVPELAAWNLGSVLVAEAIRAARADGARIFDFLRGSDPYKYRFGAADKVDVTMLVPRHVSGMLLRLKYGAKRAQAPSVRPDRVPVAAGGA